MLLVEKNEEMVKLIKHRHGACLRNEQGPPWGTQKPRAFPLAYGLEDVYEDIIYKKHRPEDKDSEDKEVKDKVRGLPVPRGM